MADVTNRRRQPKGIPTGGEFAEENRADTNDLNETDTLNERYWRDVSDEDRKRLWDPKLLAATEGEHAGEPVISQEEELNLMRRAVGDENHPGILMRGLASYIPDPTVARELAWDIALQRSLTARRGCAVDPTRCYSPALANRNMLWPMHLEQVLVKFGLSAHRARFGKRYNDNLNKWKREHKRGNPPAEERDRIWDETMIDYIAEKQAKGVSVGHGLTFSDGHNANPDAKTGKIRMYGDEPFNGRKDYEGMVDDFTRSVRAAGHTRQELRPHGQVNDIHELKMEAALDRMSVHNDTWTSVSTVRTGDMDAHSVYLTAIREGYDLKTVRERLNITGEQADRWEREAAVGTMFGGWDPTAA